MKKEKVVLKKIHLQSFIDILIDVYNGGAEFIDIVGIPDVEQDYIGITVREEYIESEDTHENQLTKEIIKQLLNSNN